MCSFKQLLIFYVHVMLILINVIRDNKNNKLVEDAFSINSQADSYI